jgi:hypothetical protein
LEKNAGPPQFFQPFRHVGQWERIFWGTARRPGAMFILLTLEKKAGIYLAD